MINLKEIRLGNYLQTKKGDRLVVDSISERGIGLSGGMAYPDFSKRDIFPIQITTWWLEQFGFEGPGEYTAEELLHPLHYARCEVWVKNETEKRQNLKFEIYYHPHDELCFFKPYTNFKYVHQLQNLFFQIVQEELQNVLE